MIGIILLVVAVIGLLVFVHELGHFVVARRNGVAVEEFGFGFPPRLFGRKVGQTIYSINLLPLGGFVRLKGEDMADTSPHSFNAASYKTKAKILLAGVGMNALIAYIILLVLCVTGLPPVIEGQFSLGQPQVAQPRQVLVAAVGPDSAAAAAGIERGDIILSGNGQSFTSEQDLTTFTKANAGETVTFNVKRQTSNVEDVQVKLKSEQEAKQQGYLGVTPLQVYKLRYGWWSPLVALGLLAQIMLGTLAAFGGLIIGLFTRGQVAETVTGPVGIVVLFSNIVHLGWSYVALLVASISVSLAVINVLPVPALDGGRLALITVQKATKRSLSPRAEGLVHLVGFVALIALMLVVTLFDLKRL